MIFVQLLKQTGSALRLIIAPFKNKCGPNTERYRKNRKEVKVLLGHIISNYT